MPEIHEDAKPLGPAKDPTAPFVTGVKAAVGLVVVAFSGAMSLIGLSGAELTTALRNQLDSVELMALFILLAIIAALLSVFLDYFDFRRRLRLGEEIGFILLQVALFAGVEPLTRIPVFTTSAQVDEHLVAVVVFCLLAAAMFVWSHASREPDNVNRRETRLPGRQAGTVNLYVFLLMVSLLFTSIAVYMALRIEVRNQVSAGVAIQASLQATASEGVLSLSVSASHLLTVDFVRLEVSSLPSSARTNVLCKNVATTPGDYSCVQDPCSYPTVQNHCTFIAGWDIPPDSEGNVSHELTFPFSTASYRQLHIETQVCQRRSVSSPCDYDLAPRAHLELVVPSP